MGGGGQFHRDIYSDTSSYHNSMKTQRRKNVTSQAGSLLCNVIITETNHLLVTKQPERFSKIIETTHSMTELTPNEPAKGNQWYNGLILKRATFSSIQHHLMT